MSYKIETDYSSANCSIILDLKTTGKNIINSAKTTSEVTKALDDAKAEIDKVLTTVQEISLNKAKADAIAELTRYKVSDKADYSPTNWTTIEGFRASGITTINSATTTANVAQALTDAQKEIDIVKTDQDLVNAEAAKIQSQTIFNRIAGTVQFPAVGAEYTISVKVASDPSKYDADGKFQTNGTSTVVYTVKHTASGKTADTGQVLVWISTIPKYSFPIDIGSRTSEVMPRDGTMEFTFTDDPQWRGAIFSISYGLEVVSSVDKKLTVEDSRNDPE
ncbi:hypothetical protein [Psychrobacillus psychrotolerans]|uniref:hypothetical protein n=1 Tax=Psychrobacillus psychrotolerans TaxID=126156 RepID=UPI0033155F3A